MDSENKNNEKLTEALEDLALLQDVFEGDVQLSPLARRSAYRITSSASVLLSAAQSAAKNAEYKYPDAGQ